MMPFMFLSFRSKKGFAVNQLFVYATAVIIMSLILFFGVKSVGIFNSHSCDIQLADLTNVIESRVREVSTNHGSVRKLDMSLPCSATKICIADFDAEDTALAEQTLRLQASPLASGSYADGVDNVFLMKGNDMLLSFRLDAVSVGSGAGVNTGVVCDDTPASFRLEGVGRKARITLW